MVSKLASIALGWLSGMRQHAALLLACLPLLGSMYFLYTLRAEQARLLSDTPSLPVTAGEPAPLAVAWVRDLGGRGLYAGTAGGRVFASRGDAVEALDEASGEAVWSQALDEVSALALMDGVLVVGAANGELEGLDAGSGARLWHRDGVYAGFASNLVTSQRAGDGAWLAVYDPLTGEARWDKRVADGDFVQALAQVEVDGAGRLVLARDLQALFALDAQDGTTRWRAEVAITPQDVLWIDDQVLVYQTFSPGQVCTLSLADGHILWCTGNVIVEEGREWPVKPAFDADRMLLKTDRYTLAGLALDSGEAAWTFAADQPHGPITFQSYRPSELDAVDGTAYFAFGDEGYVVYAVDAQSGQPLWRSEALNLFDVDVLAQDQDRLFLTRFQPDEAEILVISKADGQLLGRLASGVSPDPVMVNTGAISTQAPSGVTLDERGLLVYGNLRSVPAPGVPNLSVGPAHRLLVRFSPEVDHAGLAARSRDWWGAGDEASAWYTLETALRNSGRVAPDSPLAGACRDLLGARLGDLRRLFAQGDYAGVLDHFSSSKDVPMFHPLARSCPGGQEALAQGYLLAGRAYAGQAEAETWYHQPLDNPYYRQLLRDVPDSPQAAQARTGLVRSRQVFIAGLWERHAWLLALAMGLPLAFWALARSRAGRAGQVAAVMLFFNLAIAGPLFDMTAFEMRALKPIWANWGLGMWQIAGACLMGVGGLVALAAALATPPAQAGLRGKLGWGWIAVCWVLDSAVMVIGLASMFPLPFN
jgi:outer membrane protein assembly factor BamB